MHLQVLIPVYASLLNFQINRIIIWTIFFWLHFSCKDSIFFFFVDYEFKCYPFIFCIWV